MSNVTKLTQAAFRTTHWSVVLGAGASASPAAHAALEALCRTYWSPLYAFVRRQGRAPADAQDLVQGFFAHLLEHDGLAGVRQERGRFRSFLLTALKNFLVNEHWRERAQKRGGRYEFVSWDDPAGEAALAAAAPGLTPDAAYDQQWVAALLRVVMEQLRAEYARLEKSALFAALQPHLSGDGPDYASTAAELGLGRSAMKMAVLRLRRRYGELLRAEIAQTLDRPADVDAELRALLRQE